MVELVTADSQVRDLTTAPRQIPIETEGSVAFEVILAMWTTFNPHEKSTSFDLGPEWHREIIENLGDDFETEIKTLGGPYLAAWLGVAGLLQTAPHPHDPDSVFDWLENLDPMRLRRWLLDYACLNGAAALIEAAANGDRDALLELFEEKDVSEMKDQLIAFFDIPDSELPKRMAQALKRFRAEAFAEFEEEFGGAISRAAAARRAVATRGDAKAVIEEVTNGLEYEVPLGVTRVVLIPSVVTRPLSIIDQQRGTLLVYYGVADEFINSDPEAPPSWLLRAYKALGDERRLRILRRLSEGETTLDELTQMLGLSKSTVHHHISLLRGAGLIRVHVGPEEKKLKTTRYTLREQALADAGGFLDSYLRTNDEEAHHV